MEDHRNTEFQGWVVVAAAYSHWPLPKVQTNRTLQGANSCFPVRPRQLLKESKGKSRRKAKGDKGTGNPYLSKYSNTVVSFSSSVQLSSVNNLQQPDLWHNVRYLSQRCQADCTALPLLESTIKLTFSSCLFALCSHLLSHHQDHAPSPVAHSQGTAGGLSMLPLAPCGVPDSVLYSAHLQNIRCMIRTTGSASGPNFIN